MKKKIDLSFKILTGFFLFFVSGCDNSGDEFDRAQDIQNLREALVTNIFDAGINPLSIAYQQKATALKESLNELSESPNLEYLELSQNRWMELLEYSKQLEVFNTIMHLEGFIPVELMVYFTDVSEIEESISGSDIIDIDFIQSKNFTQKGIFALEYFLFSPEGNQTVLERILEPIRGQRRLSYALYSAQDLEDKSQEIIEFWNNSETDFKENLQNDLDGSINLLVNSLNDHLIEILAKKLDLPLGYRTGGVLRLDLVEAKYSNQSLFILTQNLEAIRNCFSGDFSLSQNQIGFDDYLKAIDEQDLNNAIISSIEKCNSSLENLSNNLVEEIENSPAQVNELRNNFQQLLVLLRVDLPSVLDVSILISDVD